MNESASVEDKPEPIPPDIKSSYEAYDCKVNAVSPEELFEFYGLPSPSQGTGTRNTWPQHGQAPRGGSHRISVFFPNASKCRQLRVGA